MPDLSVIICTYNPVPHILSWALDSLEQQNIARDRFEVVIVDNASERAVQELEAVKNRDLDLRIVYEQKRGTAFARVRGILEANAELLVLLDDDNYIDPQYLKDAIAIARDNPNLGAFGGVARFLSDGGIDARLAPLLIYLGVRHYGDDVITSNENTWGKWEPIGAGMVFRRDVGCAFVETMRTNPLAAFLGRSDKSYICGEDSLLARCGYRLGYSCSYQPSLKLTHLIRPSRLKPLVLAKTIEGIALANVLCELVLGTTVYERPSATTVVRELAARLRHRIRTRGLRAGLLEWAWDVGYYRGVHRYSRPANG